MAELEVFHKDKRLFRVPVESDVFHIGRSSQNDLILTGDEVSRQHVCLKRQLDGLWLEDSSTMGTFLDGSLVEGRTQLKDTHDIGIADWRLVFHPDSDLQKKQQHTRKTQVTGLIKKQKTSETHLLEFVPCSDKFRVIKPLLVVEECGQKNTYFVVNARKTVVGSSAECDVVIKDPCVSKCHVELTLSDKGFLVKDLNSKNGTFVHGSRIKESYLLQDSEIRLGESRILVSFDKQAQKRVPTFSGNSFCGLVSQSAVMKSLFSRIQMAAQTDMTTLIHGASGTGKEMVARALHDLSPRREKPYVVINCGAISANLIESELFGHERGAFTGADQRHMGVFERAHGGTLFLDEVGELPLEMQTKILRVLEYKTLTRVGGKEQVAVDVRVVAATHRDLVRMVSQGDFREDLFYRLYVLPLEVPELAERVGDVPLLAKHFVDQVSHNKKVLSESAMAKLNDHSWPGNVRELKNTLMRAVAFCPHNEIDADHIEFIAFEGVKESGEPTDEADQFKQVKNEVERQRILKALKHCQGDKAKTAQYLNMGRSTLFRKLRDLGIPL